jgi:uncharacterized protein
MKVVSHTSPLIFLTKINGLSFLDKYEIIIPEEVLKELNEWEKIDLENYLRLKKWIGNNNVVVNKTTLLDNLPPNLGKGEKAAISLAVKEGVRIILIDEKKGRITAHSLGLIPRGTIALIVEQIKKKRITREEGNNLVFELIKKGCRIKEELIAEFLQNI